MGIVVEKPGILTTVQDAGRFGYQQYGVSPAGPMDTRSFQLANILTGNRPDEGALEFTVAGPSLRFEQDNVIAVTGGDLSPSLDGRPVPMYQAVAVKEGEENSDAIKALVEALTSPEVKQFMEQRYEGAVVPLF